MLVNRERLFRKPTLHHPPNFNQLSTVSTHSEKCLIEIQKLRLSDSDKHGKLIARIYLPFLETTLT